MLGRKRAGERIAKLSRRPVDDPNPVALHGGDRRQGAHLAETLAWAGGKLEAGRVGAVDDVEIVVAGKEQGPFGQPRMPGQRRKELGPLCRPSRIGSVPGDEDQIERPLGVDCVELGEQRFEPLIPAGSGPAALDAKTVPFPNDVDVREMRDPPCATCMRAGLETVEIARLGHRRIGDCRYQRGGRQIGQDQHDAVGQSHAGQQVRGSEIRDGADPARARPDKPQRQQRERADDDPGRGGRGRAPAAAAGLGRARREQLLDEVRQPLARDRVARLDDKRVQ